MKKTLLIIAALIVSSFASAQQMFKIENPEPTDREGWVGNTDVTYMSMMENTIGVMAPHQIDPDISGTITKLKFYRYIYGEYNTASFTLKIYENIDLQIYDEYMNYYYFESCGDEVYSQDFTATGQGWQTIELDTPYEIPDGDFWVGVKMNGEGMLLYGNQANSILGQYYYSDRYEFVWYWKPALFVNDWHEVLFSLAMAVYVEDGGAVSCNPVQNLHGEGWVDGQMAELFWEAPENGSTGTLTGYNVYRDGVKINDDLVVDTEFIDWGDDGVPQVWGNLVPYETYTYYVEAVYSDGCTSQCDPIEVKIEIIENVAENSNVKVEVYPNPAEGFVNVTAEGLRNVELIDMMGRIISRNESSETAAIDLSGLASGIYFLRLTTEKGVALQRLEVK
ncbi:MAG: T9SS type A sorting domain-containing protein [Bacteroidia bacterium]|nr:T9SS type A sorting domain-containing protein [Bacteroidia bacterium]